MLGPNVVGFGRVTSSKLPKKQANMIPYSTACTLPETNIAPEIDGWKIQFPFGMAYVQVLC